MAREPTKLDFEHHVASGHTQHRTWCGACMSARGIAGRHERREPGREDEDPLLATGSGYLKLDGAEDDDDDTNTHTRSMVLDPYVPCDDSRRSGGSTRIPSPTGYEPKVIEPEDLEPRRIEIDKNHGTDPYQTQERMGDNYQNPITEDMDEFGKVGVEMSYIQ